MGFEELRIEALKLNSEFRAKLARELLFSLDDMSGEEVENLWVEEAIRRDDEIDRGDTQLRPAKGKAGVPGT